MVGGVIVFVKDIREADSYSATASFLNILKGGNQGEDVAVMTPENTPQNPQGAEIVPEISAVDSSEVVTPAEDEPVVPSALSSVTTPTPAPLASVFMSITAPIGPLGGGGGASSPAPTVETSVSSGIETPTTTSTVSSTETLASASTIEVSVISTSTPSTTTTSDGREMLEKTFVPLLMCVPVVSTTTASVANANHLVLSRLIVDNEGADTNEFIEISNPTGTDVLLTGWSLQYLSGGVSSFASITKKNFIASTTVPSGGGFIVGFGDFEGEADMRWSQSLNNAGATIFLVQGQTIISGVNDVRIVDRVAYGTGSGLQPEGEAAPLPAIEQALLRKSVADGACVVSAEQVAPNYGCDSENNASDFSVESVTLVVISSE